MDFERRRVAQLAGGGDGPQFVVGHARPEEIRQAIREFVVGQIAHRFGSGRGLAFNQVHEVRRRQHAADGAPHGGREVAPLAAGRTIDCRITFDLGRFHGAAEGAGQKLVQAPNDDRLGVAGRNRRHVGHGDRFFGDMRGRRPGGRHEAQVVEQHIVAAELRAVDFERDDRPTRRRVKGEERVVGARAVGQRAPQRVARAVVESRGHHDFARCPIAAENRDGQFNDPFGGTTPVDG